MPDSPRRPRAHLVAGGFPRHSWAGHDIDFVRHHLLSLLQAHPGVVTTVAQDFADLADWLPEAQLLVTYVAGPYPQGETLEALRAWIEGGGRWLALHGTSGGRAVPLEDGRPGRTMMRLPHHELLGAFFLNHPPIRRFSVDVRDSEHPITEGVPDRFEVMDELYLLELLAPDASQVLLSTADLPADDPAPKTFGFSYDEDTSVGEDGRTRALGYVRTLGRGEVAYIGLGHCHTPSTNIQPFVDASVDPEGKTPLEFKGPWESEAFQRLVRNGIDWGLEAV